MRAQAITVEQPLLAAEQRFEKRQGRTTRCNSYAKTSLMISMALAIEAGLVVSGGWRASLARADSDRRAEPTRRSVVPSAASLCSSPACPANVLDRYGIGYDQCAAYCREVAEATAFEKGKDWPMSQDSWAKAFDVVPTAVALYSMAVAAQEQADTLTAAQCFQAYLQHDLSPSAVKEPQTKANMLEMVNRAQSCIDDTQKKPPALVKYAVELTPATAELRVEGAHLRQCLNPLGPTSPLFLTNGVAFNVEVSASGYCPSSRQVTASSRAPAPIRPVLEPLPSSAAALAPERREKYCGDMSQARAAEAASRWREAHSAYASAFSLAPGSSSLMGMGNAAAGAGKFSAALTCYEAGLARLPNANGQPSRDTILAGIHDMRARVAVYRLELEPSGAAVSVVADDPDWRCATQREWRNGERIVLGPGSYRLEIAAGSARAAREVHARAGDSETLRIELDTTSPSSISARDVAIVGSFSLAALGLAGGAFAWTKREEGVMRWNDAACTPIGSGSREDNCSAERESYERAESWALAGFITAGVGITTGVLLLLFTSDGNEDQAREAGALRCSPNFPAGMSCGLAL